jgi:hypothetical protein
MNQIKVKECKSCPFAERMEPADITICTSPNDANPNDYLFDLPTNGIHKDCPLKKEPVTIYLEVESKHELQPGGTEINEIYKPLSEILWKFYPGIVTPEIELLNKIREAVHEVDTNWQKVTGKKNIYIKN